MPPPDQTPPASQGRARHSERSVGDESNTPVDNHGAQGTDAPCQMDPVESPGLPWFRTWRGVYLFAFGCFVLYVVLLTVFSRAFS